MVHAAGRMRHAPRCSPAQSAAVSAIPGVAFSGSVDGHMRAYSATDGKIIWDFDTIDIYEHVNGVLGRGGSIDGPGPAIGQRHRLRQLGLSDGRRHTRQRAARVFGRREVDEGLERSRLAAIRIDNRALAERCLRRCQEGDEPRDFLGLAESRHTERARHLFFGLTPDRCDVRQQTS